MSKDARLIERVKQNFKALEPRFTDVVEWGDDGKPLRVWWKKLSVNAMRKVRAPFADGRPVDSVTMSMRAVLYNLTDDKGERLFGDIEEDDLAGVSEGDVVVRLGAMILYDGGKPKSEAAKIDDAKKG